MCMLYYILNNSFINNRYVHDVLYILNNSYINDKYVHVVRYSKQ